MVGLRLCVTAAAVVVLAYVYSFSWRPREVLRPPVCPLSPLVDDIYQSQVAPRLRLHQGPEVHYMDFTGSSIYLNSQLEDIKYELSSGVFGNPHSKSYSSRLSTKYVTEVRDKILRHFKADPEEYMVVFTRSATGALVLLGESFPFSDDSRYMYTVSNHNSVLGIRSYAQGRGARVGGVTDEEVERWLDSEDDDALGGSRGNGTINLFAYPAKDNYEGVLYPLEWIQRIQSKRSDDQWMVLLDTAAYAPTYRLDLGVVKPDFAVVSFYKMFGFPSGVGCWLVKRSAEAKLKRVYWGGSSVFTATPAEPWEVRFTDEAKYEDGTLPFLEIASLKAGFDAMESLGGIDRVSEYVDCLGSYLSNQLQLLKHSNGRSLVHLYGKHYENPSRQSSIANFQLVMPSGELFSYRTASSVLSDAGFQVRDGCACNPGACYRSVGVTEQEVRDKANLAAGNYTGWEWIEVERNGQLQRKPLGSVRVSLGWLSRQADVDSLVEFLRVTYLDRTEDLQVKGTGDVKEEGTAASLFGC
jgi:molybdenum cofactor sulfurtransferase